MSVDRGRGVNADRVAKEMGRVLQEAGEELQQNDWFLKAKPLWVAVAGAGLLVWGLSGAPMVVASLSASLTIYLVLGGLILGPPLLVYSDARRRHAKHPLAWSIFSLLTTPVGALIYYLLRPDGSHLRTCTQCQSVVNSSFQACPYCGTGLAAQRHECRSCANVVKADWRFCPYCRVRLDQLAVRNDAPASATDGKSSEPLT